MKRTILTALFLLFSYTQMAEAQLPRVRTSPAADLVTIEMAAIRSAVSSPWFDISAYANSTHTLTFTYPTQPSGVTVALECSNNGGASVSSTIGTSTSTTGATIQGDAVCNAIRATVSGLTGSIAILPVYRGSGPAGATSSGLLALESTQQLVLTAVSSTSAVSVTPTYSTPDSWISDGAATEIIIKAAPGVLKHLVVVDILAAAAYVRAYDSVNPDCTSATGIKQRWIIPAALTGSGGSFMPPGGLIFATGISLCVTTTIADTNNTAVAASSITVAYAFD